MEVVVNYPRDRNDGEAGDASAGRRRADAATEGSGTRNQAHCAQDGLLEEHGAALPAQRRVGVFPIAAAQRRAEWTRAVARGAVQQHRGNADVVRQELQRQHGIDVSLRTVERAVAPFRRELRAAEAATVRFETAAGEQLQIDFGEAGVCVAGERVRVHLFVATLGYSRRSFVAVYSHQRQSAWWQGIEGAFHHFGGRTRNVLMDNARALVDFHDARTREVRFNARFHAFCRYWDVVPKACAPYRARTKGKDERGVGYVKRNALAGHTFDSLAAFEAHLGWWMREVADLRIHGTTGEVPIERFRAKEATALRPLDGRTTFQPIHECVRRIHADACIELETNRYSVPWRLIGESVSVAGRRTGADPARWPGSGRAWAPRGSAPSVAASRASDRHRRRRTVVASKRIAVGAAARAAAPFAGVRSDRRRCVVKAAITDPESLKRMLTRLKLTAIRDQLDTLLDTAARRKPTLLDPVQLLCEAEVARKDERRIQMASSIAKFPFVRTLDSFEFAAQPSLDAKLVRELATCRWVGNGDALLLLGPPGVGKTHLAVALGREAIQHGYSTLTSATAMVTALTKAHHTGRLEERLLHFTKRSSSSWMNLATCRSSRTLPICSSSLCRVDTNAGRCW